MVMSFIDGTPLMQLRDKVAHLPKWQRDKVSNWQLTSCFQHRVGDLRSCQALRGVTLRNV